MSRVIRLTPRINYDLILLHMKYHPSILLCLLLLWLTPAMGLAGQLVLPLPAELSVIDMRWRNTDELVLLAQQDGEIRLSILATQAGELRELTLPRSLQRAAGADSQFSYSLAPLGNALAVVERSERLVGASRLSVFRIDSAAVTAISTYRIPMEFWPGAVCWDEAGDNLFVAARPYLQAGQPVSLAVFRLADTEFIPLLEKSGMDIIRQLAFLPSSGELAVLCGGLQGSYPADEMVVLVSPVGNTTRIVHARAGNAAMQLLDNGSLLLEEEAAGESQTWLKEPGADGFRLLEGQGLPAWGCRASRDGSWLAGLQGRGSRSELVLQTADGGRALATGLDCSQWRFCHDGSSLAVLVPAGNLLHILPTNGD